MAKLTTVKAAIAATKAAGKRIRYSAGGGISLVITPTGGARWYFQGRKTDGNLGTVPIGPAIGDGALNLTQARDLRGDAKKVLKSGTAVVSHSDTPATMGRPDSTAFTGKTFGDVLAEYIPARAAKEGWRGGEHGDEAAAYRRTVGRCSLVGLPLSAIDGPAVLAALAPWAGKRTGEKVRTRIKAILDWATFMKYRTGENPARLKGNLEYALTAPPEAKHHPALPWQKGPAFMTDVLSIGTMAAKALAIVTLTGARSNEVSGMKWGEIVGDMWTVPGGRMKGRKEGVMHTYPLSRQALALIGSRGADNDYVFGVHLRHGIMGDITRRMRKLDAAFDLTPHGLRSTLVDWAGDKGYPLELREITLAHKVGDAVAQAYNRGDRQDLRREMLQAWADFVVHAPQSEAKVA